ncbi:ATP-binding cassette domain-containing protein [Arboricoccus pini]|nr:ATP-binding cassette domain-containing protein [Arboricoccus pini]
MAPYAAEDRTGPGILFDIERVNVVLERRTILSSVSLAIKRGQVLGLIGHNGSGKSTLIRLLARQSRPTAGSIHFLNRTLDAWGHRDFARQVAYLPQLPPAAGGLLGRELVALGRFPWHGALGRFTLDDHRHVEDALAMTDTAIFADRAVDTLSGGERQRVWLAMLMAQNASVLLLDEPTSALDLAHQVDVLTLVQRLARERGLTIIVVLHEINMAARFCDRLVALRAGRIIEDDTPQRLMRSVTLERVFGLPMGIISHPEGGHPIAYVR